MSSSKLLKNSVWEQAVQQPARLWAPWRMQYIEDLRTKGGGCVFCEAALPGNDRERFVLFRGRGSFILMNCYPYNNGHLMIIPYKHTASLSELKPDEHAEMLGLAADSMDIMSASLEAEGFNCGINIGKIAGAGIVDHVHLHVVPRWLGDNNFMPVIADTRSMPEYLTATYDKLVGGFEKI